MKTNKLRHLIAGILLFSFGAKAEYLGINELAIKKSDDPIAFFNAVKAFNKDLVKQWLDQGYSVDYNHQGWCGYTENGLNDYKVTPQSSEDMNKLVQQGIFYSGSYLLPSTCDTLYLWRLIPGFNMIESEDVAQYVNKVKKSEGYQYQTNVLSVYKLIEAKIKPEQYEVYFPIIINNRPLISIRENALNKFIAGYKQKDTLLSDNEKLYQQAVIDFEKTHPSSRTDNYIFSVTNPGFVILDTLMQQFSKNESEYAKYYMNNNQKLHLPKFTMDVIKAGGVDLSKYDVDKLNSSIANYLISANGELKMIKTLLDSGIVDINSQDSEGNTVLHNLFLKQVSFRALKSNEFAGSFVRYLLENGANPLLKNKEDKTAYLIFEQSKGSDVNYPGIKQMSNAFVQKEFTEE